MGATTEYTSRQDHLNTLNARLTRALLDGPVDTWLRRFTIDGPMNEADTVEQAVYNRVVGLDQADLLRLRWSVAIGDVLTVVGDIESALLAPDLIQNGVAPLGLSHRRVNSDTGSAITDHLVTVMEDGELPDCCGMPHVTVHVIPTPRLSYQRYEAVTNTIGKHVTDYTRSGVIGAIDWLHPDTIRRSMTTSQFHRFLVDRDWYKRLWVDMAEQFAWEQPTGCGLNSSLTPDWLATGFQGPQEFIMGEPVDPDLDLIGQWVFVRLDMESGEPTSFTVLLAHLEDDDGLNECQG